MGVGRRHLLLAQVRGAVRVLPLPPDRRTVAAPSRASSGLVLVALGFQVRLLGAWVRRHGVWDVVRVGRGRVGTRSSAYPSGGPSTAPGASVVVGRVVACDRAVLGVSSPTV